MTKQVIRAFLALGIALAIMFAIRAFAFTIYTAPSDIGTMLRRGDRVMVNRLARAPLRKGNLVAYDHHGRMVGRVLALPGDTITVRGTRYLIPLQCCDRCTCPDCRLYLIDEGNHLALVYKHQMIGRAYLLFHLPI